MKIISVQCLPCIYKDATFADFKSIHFHDFTINTSSEKYNEDGYFLVSIKITAITCNHNIMASITVDNRFLLQLEEGEVKLVNDLDFWLAADFLQTALAHTRAILSEQSKHTVLKEEMLILEPIQLLYERIKTNVYSMWN